MMVEGSVTTPLNTAKNITKTFTINFKGFKV